MTDTVYLYLLAIVIQIQRIIMIVNFILHSMTDESDKPKKKKNLKQAVLNKQD